MLNKFSDIIKDTSLLLPNTVLQNNAYVHEAWKHVTGIETEIKEHVKIRMIKNNVLYFTTNNGIWAQEIQLRNTEILKKINSHIKSKTTYKLKDIVVLVGNY